MSFSLLDGPLGGGDGEGAMKREKVTFFLISYNQEDYIREAVNSAFSQTYSPLEIVLSDDHSSDSTFELIQSMVQEYRGPHEVVLNRNDRNLGLCGNVNRLIDLASGSIVVMAGGDDISEPTRVEHSVEILSARPHAMCVSLGLQYIDSQGSLFAHGDAVSESRTVMCDERILSDLLGKQFHHSGASRAFRREVFEFFGPLRNDAQTEDSTTLLRCLLLGGSCESPVVGVRYRVHGKNYSMFEQGLRIDRRKIFEQQMQDVRCALDHGLIDVSLARELRSVLASRSIAQQFDNGYTTARAKIAYIAGKGLRLSPRMSTIYLWRSVKNDARAATRFAAREAVRLSSLAHDKRRAKRGDEDACFDK